MNATEFGDRLIAEALSHGATEVRVTVGRKHRRLRFSFRGETKFYVFPGSTGDGMRAVHNALSDLRRLMGVKRVTNHSASPRRRRMDAPEREPCVPRLTMRPDPMAVLSGLRERLELETRCRLPGIDGAEARVERAGVMACERIRAWVAAVLEGCR